MGGNILGLLLLRHEGRCGGSDFRDWVLYGKNLQQHEPEKRQEWKLSSTTRIQPSHSRSYQSYNTALDLCRDSRFLLAGSGGGTVSIYDFREKTPPPSSPTLLSHAYHPIQQAETVGGNSLSSVQWYHDTGIFLTASMGGSVLLWDTAAMTPVLESQPFQYEGSSNTSLSCMQISPFSLLAATGSRGSPKVKLVDLRSGASSHSLTSVGHKGGVTAVRWSPVNSHMLASCAGVIALWDIRRPRVPLAVLDSDHRPADAKLSTAYALDGAHWRPKKRKSGGRGVISAPSSSFSSTTRDTQTTATSAVFDPMGQHLVTVCEKRREVNVWDLRFQTAPVMLPRRFVDPNNGKPVDRGMEQPLLMTGTRKSDRTVWVTKGDNMHGYSLFDNADGRPDVVLKGHLGRIVAATTGGSDTTIITSARDRLTLVWERHKDKPLLSDLFSTDATVMGRKRRIDQDADSWC